MIIPFGKVIPCIPCIKTYPLLLLGFDLLTNLIQFDLSNFDVIFGMARLAMYNAKIKYHTQKAYIYHGPKKNSITYQGIVSKPRVIIVPTISL